MKDYFVHNGKKYEVSEKTARELAKIFGCEHSAKLADKAVGETFKIGDYEFAVLEQLDGATAVICKDLIATDARFGSNNDYHGSNVDVGCNEFAEILADIVGEENILTHEVDLTAANGMKCYGVVGRKASLLTLERVQKYANVLAEHTIDSWWWLATASGTEKWGTHCGVLCVSPLGGIFNDFYCDYYGVRPFCILNSSISVS